MFCPKCGGAEWGWDEVLPGVRGGRRERDCGGGREGAGRADAAGGKVCRSLRFGAGGVIIGVGFLVVAGLSFGISIKLAVVGLFMLAFGFFFLGTGISRLAQARALKRLREPKAAEAAAPALAPGEADYIRPPLDLHDRRSTHDTRQRHRTDNNPPRTEPRTGNCPRAERVTTRLKIPRTGITKRHKKKSV